MEGFDKTSHSFTAHTVKVVATKGVGCYRTGGAYILVVDQSGANFAYRLNFVPKAQIYKKT